MDNFQLKRLIKRYEFLLDDLEDVKQINQEANNAFMAALNKNMPNGINPDDFTRDSKKDDEIKKEHDNPTEMKRLYRKMVVKCHPDKLDESLPEIKKYELRSLYEKAVEAYDEGSWAGIIMVAIKLEIDLPESTEEFISSVEEDVEKMETKIESMTNNSAWNWYHAPEDQKMQLIQNYFLTLEKLLKGPKSKPKSIEKQKKSILGVGHPRTGTKYSAAVISSWGLDVPHEKMGEDGTFDWTLASGQYSMWQGIEYDMYDWQTKIYCVRNPFEAIASIAYTENANHDSLEFRKKFIKFPDQNPLEAAVMSLYNWDRHITYNIRPDFKYRIEDQMEDLYKFLEANGLEVKWNDELIGSKINSRTHDTFQSLVDKYDISGSAKRYLRRYCQYHGYENIL